MSKEMLKNTEVPPGHVSRTLNFRDRDLIVSAAMEHVKGKDWKDALKVQRLQEVLNYEDVADYYEDVQNDYNRKITTWSKEAELCQKTGATLPDRPVLTDAEQLGKEEKFNIPSKLDAWMQDAIKNWKGWDPRLVKHFASLCGRLGFKDEE